MGLESLLASTLRFPRLPFSTPPADARMILANSSPTSPLPDAEAAKMAASNFTTAHRTTATTATTTSSTHETNGDRANYSIASSAKRSGVLMNAPSGSVASGQALDELLPRWNNGRVSDVDRQRPSLYHEADKSTVASSSSSSTGSNSSAAGSSSRRRPASAIYTRHIPNLPSPNVLHYVPVSVHPSSTHVPLFTSWHQITRVAGGWDQAWSEEKQRRYLEGVQSSDWQLGLIGYWSDSERALGEPWGYIEIYWAKVSGLCARKSVRIIVCLSPFSCPSLTLSDFSAPLHRKDSNLTPFYDFPEHTMGLHALVGEQRFRGPDRVRAWMTSAVEVSQSQLVAILGIGQSDNDVHLLQRYDHLPSSSDDVPASAEVRIGRL